MLSYKNILLYFHCKNLLFPNLFPKDIVNVIMGIIIHMLAKPKFYCHHNQIYILENGILTRINSEFPCEFDTNIDNFYDSIRNICHFSYGVLSRYNVALSYDMIHIFDPFVSQLIDKSVKNIGVRNIRKIFTYCKKSYIILTYQNHLYVVGDSLKQIILPFCVKKIKIYYGSRTLYETKIIILSTENIIYIIDYYMLRCDQSISWMSGNIFTNIVNFLYSLYPSRPIRIPHLGKIISFDYTWSHLYIVVEGGDVYQIHIETLVPIKLEIPYPVTSVGCGSCHIVFTTTVGTWGMGNNSFFQLGKIHDSPGDKPVQLDNIVAKKVICGGNCTIIENETNYIIRGLSNNPIIYYKKKIENNNVCVFML